MSSINLNIPETLTSAAARLSEAGFLCKPYRVENYGVGLTKFVTQGLTVTIDIDDPKFIWSSNTSATTPYVAQVHDKNVSYKSPSGFQFFMHNNKCSLASELYSDAQIEEFIDCFTKPFGPDNKIVGPLGIPAIKRKLRP